MEYIYSLVLFTIASSATPGPNNILVMTSGVNFGVKKSLPVFCGICVGFALMLLLVGIGFGQIFEVFPNLNTMIKIVGVGYLLYLAWIIAGSSNSFKSKEQQKPLTFLNGALFQWVNAKAWIVATGAVAAFTTSGDEHLVQVALVASTFLVLSFPSVGIWLIFGSWLKKYLNSKANQKVFNLSMASLLIISVLPVLGELIEKFT